MPFGLTRYLLGLTEGKEAKKADASNGTKEEPKVFNPKINMERRSGRELRRGKRGKEAKTVIVRIDGITSRLAATAAFIKPSTHFVES